MDILSFSYFPVNGEKSKKVTIQPSEILQSVNNQQSISFSMKILPGGCLHDWRTVFHRGIDNNERTFSVWLHPNQNRLHVCFSSNQNYNEGYDSIRVLNNGQWYNIAITYDSLLQNGIMDH
jgi:hypothetical protein